MPKYRFDTDPGAFSEEKQKARRSWRKGEISGLPWNYAKSVNAYADAGFTDEEVQDLVLNLHIRATSEAGKSLRRHRAKLIKRYMDEGMTREEAIEWCTDYFKGIRDKEDYPMDGLIELLTYQKRFVDEEVTRGPRESVDSAVDRWEEARQKVRDRRLGG